MNNIRKINSGKKKPGNISRDTVQLWRISQQIDEILQGAILDTKLNPQDVAAVIAHRLGTLIAASEDPEVLSEFCQNLVKRLSAS